MKPNKFANGIGVVSYETETEDFFSFHSNSKRKKRHRRIAARVAEIAFSRECGVAHRLEVVRGEEAQRRGGGAAGVDGEVDPAVERGGPQRRGHSREHPARAAQRVPLLHHHLLLAVILLGLHRRGHGPRRGGAEPTPPCSRSRYRRIGPPPRAGAPPARGHGEQRARRRDAGELRHAERRKGREPSSLGRSSASEWEGECV